MKSSDYIDAVAKMKVPDGTEKIIKNLKQFKERKHMSKRKITAIAAAAVITCGAVVYAASSGIITSWYASSGSRPDFKTLPAEEQCIKDCGFVPILIDEFSNGYSFEAGHIVDNALHDDGDNVAEKFKSFDFTYDKDGEKIYFSQSKYDTQVPQEGEVADSVNGTDIYYYSYVNKFVPADYKLTDEDKKAEANGELVFSYGSGEVEVMTISSASWKDGNTHYSIMQMGGSLTKEQLVDMAKEAAEK